MSTPINSEYIRKLISNNKLCFSLATVAFIAHYSVLFSFAKNIPIGDDYYDIFRFLNYYENAHFLKEKLLVIHAQHNEHRTAFNRLIYLLMYEISGSINFKALMLIGDLSTIGLIALLSGQYKSHKAAAAISSFIAIFLLNLQSWSSMLWAMTAISNYSIVFFTLACFLALSSNKTLLMPIGMLFATCASFSMGNGLLAWPLGLLCIVFNKSSKRSLHALLWLIASIIFIFIYFYKYAASTAMKVPLESVSSLTQWLQALRWFFSFLGSCWTFESNNITLATIVGTILFAAAIPCVVHLSKEKPVIACFIIFIFLSAAVTTYSRFSLFSPTEALSSRYKIYSIYLSCIVLINFFFWLSKRGFNSRNLSLYLLLVAALHTTVTYLTSLEPMRAEHNDISDSMRRWLLARQKSRFEFVFIPDGGTWIEDAIVSKRWDPRHLFSDSLYFRRTSDQQECLRHKYKGDLKVIVRRSHGAVAGEIQINDQPLIFDRIQQIISCRGERSYITKAINPSRSYDGNLVLHYLRADPIEDSNTILLFKTRLGDTYRALRVEQLP